MGKGWLVPAPVGCVSGAIGILLWRFFTILEWSQVPTIASRAECFQETETFQDS